MPAIKIVNNQKITLNIISVSWFKEKWRQEVQVLETMLLNTGEISRKDEVVYFMVIYLQLQQKDLKALCCQVIKHNSQKIHN